ncbi:MAG: hypothetical protein RR048_03885 [Oscillospiraceae bacterium]
MAYRTVNIEYGFPDVQTAMTRLSQELCLAKTAGHRAIKIIHGYGSSGKAEKSKGQQ